MNNRKGKFTILSNVILDRPYEVAAVFRELRFVPWRAEYLGYNNFVEYIGISPLFDVVDQGITIPEYSIIIEKDKKGNVSNVRVEKK